jgi:hypothetical protein
VYQIQISGTPKRANEFKGHQVAAHGDHLAAALRADTGDREEGLKPLHTITGIHKRIAGYRLLKLRAEDDGLDLLLAQAIKQPLNGHFSASPLGGI